MKPIIRYLSPYIEKDLSVKMVFISGPRQSGKTTFSKLLLSNLEKNMTGRYFNWDDAEDREIIMKQRWPIDTNMLVFDEVHKYSRWRNTLKGLFDKYGKNYKILVTGSAQLDHYRRGGDSLQGRYFLHHLLPLSFKELKAQTKDDLKELLRLGPFPEPFFSSNETEAKRWSKQYRSRIVREEIVSLEKVLEIDLIEELMIQLPQLVGSGLSINSLREDLAVSHDSVSRWLSILENLFAIFRIYPMQSSRIKSLKKEAKHYHFDWIPVEDDGARFENLIAFHLFKWCTFQNDITGDDYELSYYRDKEKREVDFVILINRKPTHFIEVKLSDSNISTGIRYLKNKFPKVKASQVLLNTTQNYISPEGVEVVAAHRFLADFI